MLHKPRGPPHASSCRRGVKGDETLEERPVRQPYGNRHSIRDQQLTGHQFRGPALTRVRDGVKKATRPSIKHMKTRHGESTRCQMWAQTEAGAEHLAASPATNGHRILVATGPTGFQNPKPFESSEMVIKVASARARLLGPQHRLAAPKPVPGETPQGTRRRAHKDEGRTGAARASSSTCASTRAASASRPRGGARRRNRGTKNKRFSSSGPIGRDRRKPQARRGREEKGRARRRHRPRLRD